MSQGVEFFLPDGSPNGVKIVSLNGWNGQVFIIPRNNLRDVRDRPEVNTPGIYFLFGDGELPSKPRVYIGESENSFKRLLNHDDNKDFWNFALVFIGSNLDRADVKYLENKSVALAKTIDRCLLENLIEPLENRLTEVKKSANDSYFDKIKFVLSLFGYAIFQEIPTAQTELEIYTFKTEDANATGTLLDNNEFIVYKGSTARIRVTPNFERHDPGLRGHLEAEGIIKKLDERSFVFDQDYIFTSPSAAGDTVAGRSVNGWTAWKDLVGNTLDENKRK